MHAFVVPIDENGHLNAKRFTDGRRAMSELQSSYADAVSDLGLERGLAGSSAKHKDIRKLYAGLNNAIDGLPEVQMNETAEQYKNRVLEEMKTIYAASKKEADDYAIQQRRKSDRRIEDEKDAIEMERAKTVKIAEHDVKTLSKKQEKLKKNVSTYEKMVEELMKEVEDLQFEVRFTNSKLQSEKDAEAATDFYYKLNEGMKELQDVNPEQADKLQDELSYVMELADQRIEREEAEASARAEEEKKQETIDDNEIN
jgi:hypothetical protein